MKFFADQDVYAVTVRYLRALGHDVLTAAECGAAQTADAEIISKAAAARRILLTRDRHFGEFVFLREIAAGVIYLRIDPTTVETCHAELSGVLQQYSEETLLSAFVVVEPGRIRYRNLKPKK